MNTVNVRIKLTPGNPPRPATMKVMLPKPSKEQREMGLLHRPLEPYEVVPLPEDIADEWLENLPYELELTRDPPTRPLYFNDIRERDMSSMDYKEQIGGRADQIKEKVAEERKRQAEALAAKQAAEAAQKPAVPDTSDIPPETMAAVVAKLESMGLQFTKKEDAPEPENNAAVDGDEIIIDEDDDYVPENNATAKDDIEKIVEEEKAAAGDKADEVEAVTLNRDDEDTEEETPTPPPPKRRRRRARPAE